MAESAKEEFGMTLVLLARLYRRELDNALKVFGLSEATALPLRYLARISGGCRQGELADMLSLEGPTLVRVLDQLVAKGFVDRREDEADRRAKIITLTEEGRALHEKLREHLDVIRLPLFTDVSEKDLKVALKVLSGVLQNVSGKQDVLASLSLIDAI